MADQRGILPVEILQKIFHFLDGKTLLLLRSISSVWKDAIDEYLQKFSMKQWQWMCMETIPINSLIQFLKSELPLSSHLSAKHAFHEESKVDLSWVDWQKVFETHQNLHNKFRWSQCKSCIFDLDLHSDPITCVRITGNLILTGHTSGLLCLWGPEQTMIDLVENLHNNQITEVIFGDVFHAGPYFLASDEQLERDYVANHHFSVSAGLDGKVQVRGLAFSQVNQETGELVSVSETLELAVFSCRRVQVNLLGNILAVFSHDNSISIWCIEVPVHFSKVPRKLPRFIPTFNVNGPDSMLFMGNLWPNNFFPWIKKLTVTTRNGKAWVLQNLTSGSSRQPRLFETIWTSPRGNNLEMTLIDRNENQPKGKKVNINTAGHFMDKSVQMTCLSKEQLLKCLEVPKDEKLDIWKCVKWGKVYRDDLFLMLNKKHQLLISIDGFYFKAYGPFKNVYGLGQVTSVVYFSDVFVLGFSSGHIRIYFVPNPIDLLNLDFDDCMEFEAGQDPILNLDLAPGLETSINLVATSEIEVYVYQL